MKNIKKLVGILLVITFALSIAGCSSNKAQVSSSSAPEKAETVTIKLGVVGENNEQWKPVIEALAKENITLELVKFSDYTLPNQALADGEIDLNSFQHYAFLESEVKDKGLKVTAIGETIIAPLGLYSKKIKSISELKEGDKIAIPNDATNGGRSLKVLESAGLIKVNPDAGYVPTVNDIAENPLKLEFYEVGAAQTSGLLPDVAAAIINGGHAVDAGLNPEKDAIYLETVTEGSGNPYINIIAARTADKGNDLYKKVVVAFRTDEVAEVIRTTYKGAYTPAWK